LRLIVLLLALAAPLAALRPLTHEDVWTLRRLGAPHVSPDGRWVVFSVTEPDYNAEKSVTDLWIVPADGSAPERRLTAVDGTESDPQWSPDSKRLLFRAKREDDEASQVYVLDMTGPGEARRVTSLSTGVDDPQWSPDGRSIAFSSRIYPGARTDEENAAEKKERKDRDYNVSAYDGFPIRYFDKWRDDRRTHLFVQDLDSDAARDLFLDSELAGRPGFSGALSGSMNFVWAPDGKSLVFAATTNLDERARADTPYRLFQVSTEGGEFKPLTPEGASFSSPRFSPSGDALYFTRTETSDFAYNLTRLARLAWPVQGDLQIVTDNLDRSVSSYRIAGSKAVFLSANDAGRVRLYRTGDGKAAAPLNPAGRGAYRGFSVSSSEEPVLVATWEDSTHPAEIVRVEPRTGKHQPLTSLNQSRVSEIDWSPFREFWFTSSKGRRIHNWMALPPGFDESKKYPLLLFIHGGPHSSSLDAGHIRWSAQLMAQPGYVVLMTDYTGSVGYGEQFARNIQGDPLRTPGMELIEAADYALKNYSFIDPQRQAASGASYGGHLVNWLQAVTTDRFRCFVGHAGLVSLEGQWGTSDGIYHRERNNGGAPWSGSPVWKEQSPSTYAENFTTPMLLTIGERDYRVPLNQTLWTWSILQRLDTPSKLLVFHDANHWISKGPDARYFWQELHAWLDRYLGD